MTLVRIKNRVLIYVMCNPFLIVRQKTYSTPKLRSSQLILKVKLSLKSKCFKNWVIFCGLTRIQPCKFCLTYEKVFLSDGSQVNTFLSMNYYYIPPVMIMKKTCYSNELLLLNLYFRSVINFFIQPIYFLRSLIIPSPTDKQENPRNNPKFPPVATRSVGKS